MPGGAIDLGDGLVLRAAGDDDVEAVVALEVAAFGASDGPAVRAHLTGPGGPEAWSVVEDRGRVVSAVAAVEHRMALDGVAFPAVQYEYVATDPDHRGRGLVRRQFDWHHRRSAALGHLAQFVGGIPYLYRRFGYGYGLDHARLSLSDPARVEPPAGVSFRPATEEDLPLLLRWERRRPTGGLRVVRDERAWRLLLALAADPSFERVLIAERGGSAVGWCRLHRRPEEQRCSLLPSMAADDDVVAAMIHEAHRYAGELLVVGYDHPGTRFADALGRLGEWFRLPVGVYTRIPDPVALLEHLRPVLRARLAASELADGAGELPISRYRDGLVIRWDHGEVEVAREAPRGDPLTSGGVGVPPDWFGALVFGRWSPAELERRVDDVIIAGHHRALETFFPARVSDVVGDF